MTVGLEEGGGRCQMVVVGGGEETNDAGANDHVVFAFHRHDRQRDVNQQQLSGSNK